jgi:hypothetical protein
MSVKYIALKHLHTLSLAEASELHFFSGVAACCCSLTSRVHQHMHVRTVTAQTQQHV